MFTKYKTSVAKQSCHYWFKNGTNYSGSECYIASKGASFNKKHFLSSALNDQPSKAYIPLHICFDDDFDTY